MTTYEEGVEAILAEMHADPKPNYTWYTLRLQTLPRRHTHGDDFTVNFDVILRNALGEVCNHMAKAYGLGEYKKK